MNAFGMEVPDKQKPNLSQKNIQDLIRKQNQAKAREEQANRDRQRVADREKQLQRQEQERQYRVAREEYVEKKRLERKLERRKNQIQSTIDGKVPVGKVYRIDDVKYLNKYSTQEREIREQSLIQSLRDRGVFIYVDDENGVSWIEMVEEDWEQDWDLTESGATGYRDLLAEFADEIKLDTSIFNWKDGDNDDDPSFNSANRNRFTVDIDWKR